jgi:hypothetical protein
MSILKWIQGNRPDHSGTETIACPFCNRADARVISQRADIVICNSCGITYLRTRPTQESMYRIYQLYANDTSHMRPPDTLQEAKQAGLRRKYFADEIISLAGDRKGVWLDVGCGWGAFLDEVRDRGFTPKGIEITRNCLDYATMQLQIPVSNSQFLDSRIGKDSCRMVSMIHVLEHLPYPHPVLQKVFEILEPGGMFCGIVPNIESLCSRQLKDNWVWLDPMHHYVHYAPATLEKALKAAGFSVVRMYTAVGDYDYDVVAATVLQRFPAAGTIEKARSMIPDLEAEGQGEEIRFFAAK